MSESDPPSQPDEILVDLLIKQVTEGLSPAEQRALDVLDSPVASAYAGDFERAAAAIALAGSAGAESLPPPLRARLEEQAQAFFASSPAGAAGTPGAAVAMGAGSSTAAAPGVRSADKVVELRTPTPSAGADRPAGVPPRAARSATAGWWAAAACLVLAVFGWLRSPPPAVAPVASMPPTTAPGLGPPIEPRAAPPAQVPAPPPTPAEERAALLARRDSLKIALGATKDPGAAGMSGDVVWNPVTQQGFLHFVGLRPNDPQMHQYQLWIFDGTRDQRYPVDGGVFDVPANQAEVVVPIRASLPVRTPKAFAVTIEKSGGVVVSGRQHVVALGQTS